MTKGIVVQPILSKDFSSRGQFGRCGVVESFQFHPELVKKNF